MDQLLHRGADASPARDVAPALETALAVLDPEWITMTAYGPGGEGRPPPVTDLVLLHPHFGIALLDIAATPKRARDLCDAMRRLLHETGVPQALGGYPPIAYCRVAPDKTTDLRALLQAAFQRLPPLSLRRGDDWTRTVHAVLTEGARTRAFSTSRIMLRAELHGARTWSGVPSPGRGQSSKWLPVARGWTALLTFWAGLFVLCAVTAGVLQYLGPPADLPAGRGGRPAPDLAAAQPSAGTEGRAAEDALLAETTEPPQTAIDVGGSAQGTGPVLTAQSPDARADDQPAPPASTLRRGGPLGPEALDPAVARPGDAADIPASAPLVPTTDAAAGWPAVRGEGAPAELVSGAHAAPCTPMPGAASEGPCDVDPAEAGEPPRTRDPVVEDRTRDAPPPQPVPVRTATAPATVPSWRR